MSNFVPLNVALSAEAFLTRVRREPPVVDAMNEKRIAEVRHVDRTPTAEFLAMPLPGVALSKVDVQRIQNSKPAE